ncbi:hypothetical protein [Micromonospora haikouensis]|uniref:hypothetical protein n=1 Tax=Micromonospora haikouensis TaxID=686309 RepID=UPI00114D2BEC|nr:hypothetical protein [Micromonospora haikouensis]
MGGAGDVWVDRLRGGVLAGLAVLLVVAGGAWWRGAAPRIDPTGGPDRSSDMDAVGAVDSVDAVDSVPTGRETVRVAPGDSPQFFVVDPANGRVVFRSPRRAVVLDGPTGRVLADDASGSVSYDRGGDLGGFGTLWQARLTLRPGLPPQQRAVPAAGSRPHLLQARCTGLGELVLVAFPFGQRESHRVACDGSSATVLLDGGRKLRFVLAASGDAPVVVDARLAALVF